MDVHSSVAQMTWYATSMLRSTLLTQQVQTKCAT